MENEDVLKHEQLHFDIHEVYMRKLFLAFTSAKYTADYREEIKTIFQDIMGQLHTAQIKYDTDAEHSVNKDLQQYWEKYIHRQLDNTSPIY
jgi:predicted secreted Zn-dependent protease